jgi:hypothetical protein
MPKEDTQFKPGQSGNPGGRVKMPDDIKAAKRLNKIELERLLNRLIWMTKEELLAHLRDKETPGFEVLIGNIVLKGIAGGDHQRAEFLIQRLVGKVQDELKVTGLKPYVAVLSDGKEIIMGVKDEGEESA